MSFQKFIRLLSKEVALQNITKKSCIIVYACQTFFVKEQGKETVILVPDTETNHIRFFSKKDIQGIINFVFNWNPE
jgi:proteasome assembly chaperone (PAC2) family protein